MRAPLKRFQYRAINGANAGCNKAPHETRLSRADLRPNTSMRVFSNWWMDCSKGFHAIKHFREQRTLHERFNEFKFDSVFVKKFSIFYILSTTLKSCLHTTNVWFYAVLYACFIKCWNCFYSFQEPAFSPHFFLLQTNKHFPRWQRKENRPSNEFIKCSKKGSNRGIS